MELKRTKGSSDEGGFGGIQRRVWDSLNGCWEGTASCSRETMSLDLYCTPLASVCAGKGMNNKAKG